MERRQIDRGAPHSHDWIVALVSLLEWVCIVVHVASRTGSGVAFSNTRPRARVHQRTNAKNPTASSAGGVWRNGHSMRLPVS